MRRIVLVLVMAFLLLAIVAPAAFAAPPCNNNGTPVDDVAAGATGADYAKHHIVPLAKARGLGAGGHMPGDHMGFSTCNPSGMET